MKKLIPFKFIAQAFIFSLQAQTFEWAFQAGGGIGGGGSDAGTSVVIDINANVIVTGVNSGTIIFGGQALNSRGYFISKFDSTGFLIWG